MNAKQITSSFAMIGARFKTRAALVTESDYALDIQHDRQGQFFELRTPAAMARSLDVIVPQADKRDRHLLLFVRKTEGTLDRFLCGHDEREWFVAAVPRQASSVLQAKQALKPQAVRARLGALKVPTRFHNERKTRAFKRQGEWFFVPRTDWDDRINDWAALRNEPLRRGAGKPHMVEELYRVGGEVVYVCAHHPNGINEMGYRRILRSNPAAAQWDWQVLRRSPRVYARGTVRHADHATIHLGEWHRVFLNTETESPTMRNVAFLD
jgi:hypothetical protein